MATAPTVDVVQPNIVIVRSFLSIPEQVGLWHQIQEAAKTFTATRARNAQSNFVKIVSMNSTTKKWKGKIPPLFFSQCDRVCEFVSHVAGHRVPKINPTYVTSFMYPVEGGCLTPHIDWDSGWVMLFSLGQTARFFAKTPQMKTRFEFDFCSGDVLLFDGAKTAKIQHGMAKVLPQTIPAELQKECPDLVDWRVSLQLRVFEDKKHPTSTADTKEEVTSAKKDKKQAAVAAPQKKRDAEESTSSDSDDEPIAKKTPKKKPRNEKKVKK